MHLTIGGPSQRAVHKQTIATHASIVDRRTAPARVAATGRLLKNAVVAFCRLLNSSTGCWPEQRLLILDNLAVRPAAKIFGFFR
jgi:hypothetical protein